MSKDIMLQTRSGIPLKATYAAEDLDAEYIKNLGASGEYPFTRGVKPDMYRSKLWTMRQYAGFGTAEESNQRYRYLLAHGTTGLSVAFDLPTQLGLDPDHARSKGEVGKVGVSISSIEDMKELFHEIDLSQISTSMTINATANILFAFYVALAREKNILLNELRGTVQNDVLKEYVARGNYIFPPGGTLRLATDLIAWSAKNTPKWNSISISGYHIREAGSTAVQELAFTFANAIAYLEATLKKGLDIDCFASQLSFFFNVHSDFFEEIAKFRAARRIWAKITKEKYGAKNPKSSALRFHAQTAGSTLTAQQAENNVVRVTLQALSAVLGGVQSLHTNSQDEALGLPTEESVRLALRTQQIIAFESQVTNAVDPLGGSWFIEYLTNEIEHRTWIYLEDIKNRGGMIKCIESGFIQSEILNSAYLDQKKIESQEFKIVGVNCFVDNSKNKTPKKVSKISPELEKKAIEKVRAFKSKRSVATVNEVLSQLREGAKGGEDLQGLILNAAQGRATLGEISDVLREVFGVQGEFSGF
ncbi:MAG: methylmalonyl-CoA mutase [Bdellovibrio sp.]|nr:methylmalonyl-CoA mutase [Bdellovibrio sp.]